MPEPVSDECPICGKPSARGRTHPFCSPRCADVDLGRWFTGGYAVPVREDEIDEVDLEALDPTPPLG